MVSSINLQKLLDGTVTIYAEIQNNIHNAVIADAPTLSLKVQKDASLNDTIREERSVI